jgi:ParB family transcriptional regulator, chromosome partitioning protein
MGVARIMCKEDDACIKSIFERLNRVWPSFMRNNLRVLWLPSDVLEVVRAGKLEYTKAILIARIKDDVKRAELLTEVLEQSFSKRQIEQRLTTLKTKSDLRAEAKHLERELSQ